MNFGNILIRWYNINKRDLPWRHTRNPYLIWLSEIIMQQTRIEQGLAYYNLFAKKYPDVASLAKAKEDDVLKLWQGLGYYSRARNLHSAAKQIIKDYKGQFPVGYANIRLLKGVGDYTASAIASFAYDEEHAVVDGNVFRLLSRHFGIDTPIDSSAGKNQFQSLAAELIKGHAPAVYNQAIMEFGSRQCKPSNPDCENCPLNISCFAFATKSIVDFPVKKNKTKSRDRFFHYLVINHNNSFYIKKRKEKDIWQGLHDFPLIESEKRIDEPKLISSDELTSLFGKGKIKLESVSIEYKHVLSHQNIIAKFYEITLQQKSFNEASGEWKKVNHSSVKKYAVPRLIEKYIQESQLLNFKK